MIVDCHTHIMKYPEHITDVFIKEQAKMKHKPKRCGVDLDEHYEAMKVVDKAIVLGFRAKYSGIVVPNDYIADYVKRDPGKLIGFMSIDPNEPNPVNEIERCYYNLGLKGIKLAPMYQNFHPHDNSVVPIYQKAQELNLPIIFHMGATYVRIAPLKYTTPILLEDIALQYPNLKIVIAHVAHPWEAEALVLIRKQPNVYCDVSALFYRPWQFYNTMMLAIEYGVTHKLLFGSDYPATTPKESIRGIYNFDSFVKGTNFPEIPKKVKENIIKKDSLALLGLK